MSRELLQQARAKGPKDLQVNAEALRALFNYDAETGVITNARTRSSNALAGEKAGYKTRRGYLLVKLWGKNLMLHRLAWMLHYGQWPTNLIDHINENKSDNRICNLRDVDFQTNMQNVSAKTSRNTSGVRGVYLDKKHGFWRASISHNGKAKSVGIFRDIQSASEAYLNCKRTLHEGFAK